MQKFKDHVPVTGFEILTPLPESVKQTLAAKIAAGAVSIGSKALDQAKVKLEIGLHPFLEKTYNRCRFYKTILDPFKPSDLEETYIHVSLEHPNQTQKIKDTSFVNAFVDGERLVATGLAGCGKSMLMRHLALRTFESSEKIPLFIELRKINERKSMNLVDFLFDECKPISSTFTKRQFSMALQSGTFAIILDGFDEVEYDLRRKVSREIQDFVLNHPKVAICVSSRPDRDTFSAWSDFNIYQVEKFDRRQTKDLVKLARYKDGVKERFLKALDDRLFASHGDFLKSPLLTIIMLLTFEDFAEIPNKMHAFYARAFDTLFQKHDADKEQFVRKIKTNLSREDFRLILCSFCAISYLEERFTFTRETLDDSIDKGIKFASNLIPNLDVRTADYIADLKDAVCLIQEDGMNFIFVHRSFQEYFTAVFIDKLRQEKVASFIDRIADRYTDNVIPMAIDLTRDRVESCWVLPTIDRYLHLLNPNSGKRNTAKVFKELLGNVRFFTQPNGKASIGWHFPEVPRYKVGPLEVICREYPEKLGATAPIKSIRGLSSARAYAAVHDIQYARRKNYKNVTALFDPKNELRSFVFDITPADSWWLNCLGFGANFDQMYTHLVDIRNEVQLRLNNRTALLDDLLG